MSLLKADTIKPVTSGGDLSLQGDSGGSAVDCLNITSAGDINFTGNTDAKIKLPSAGGIYESDGSTAILTETGAAVTLDNVTLGSSVIGIGAGKLGQLVSVTTKANVSITSTSFVDITGLTLAITPSATSSKIWVSGHVNWGLGENYNTWFQLLRDSTVINDSTAAGVDEDSFYATAVSTSGYSILWTAPINFLDSPSTTSAVTYKVKIRSAGGTLQINRVGAVTSMGGTSTITLLEVLA